MAEILSQEEIDRLLAAINAGDPGPEDFRPAPDTRKIKIYDFKRPDKFSREHIRTVQAIYETFARSVTSALSSYFRTMVHVHVASIDQLTYEEFIRSIPIPTTLSVVDMCPLSGSAVLEIEPVITNVMINRLFGGSGTFRHRVHELTDLERTAIKEVIDNIVAIFKEAWECILPLEPKVRRLETNPQFMRIAPPDEMVVLVTLEVKAGDEDGMMNICLPSFTLEPIMPRLSAASRYEKTDEEEGAVWLRPKITWVSKEEGMTWRRYRTTDWAGIDTIPILMKAELFSRVCTMDEILGWKKRTVIYPHDKMNLEKCVIKIDDFTVFSAEIVKNFNIYNRMVKIEKILKPYRERFMENKTKQVGEFDVPGISSILKDVNIQVSVELGRTRRMIKQILSMEEGTIIELDKLAGEPVDILANNAPIAKGEVVVIDENFGVRVTELLSNTRNPE
jgi:flagellar motor switch protein FliM